MQTVFEVDSEHTELSTRLAAQGVEYVFASFVDIAGRAKSKCVPIEHLPDLMAGHERYTPRGLGNLGQMTPTEDECVAVPDAETLCILPWDRRFAFMTADLYFGGTEPFAHCTRSVLK
jgi:glutamine synthetase